MVMQRTATLTSFAALLMIMGCATTSHGDLVRSADRLESSADTLASDNRAYASGASYSRAARELADQAHEFRRTVQDRHAERGDVETSFERVSRSYHALRDDVDRSGSRDSDVNLRPVTEAYLDMERAMGGYRGGDRYARDGRYSER